MSQAYASMGTTWLPGRPIRDERGAIVGREPAEPCPELLTEEEAARFLRLDGEAGPKEPYKTLYEYRRGDRLRATRIGKQIFYARTELLRFVRLQTEGYDPRDRG